MLDTDIICRLFDLADEHLEPGYQDQLVRYCAGRMGIGLDQAVDLICWGRRADDAKMVTFLCCYPEHPMHPASMVHPGKVKAILADVGVVL